MVARERKPRSHQHTCSLLNEISQSFAFALSPPASIGSTQLPQLPSTLSLLIGICSTHLMIFAYIFPSRMPSALHKLAFEKSHASVSAIASGSNCSNSTLPR